MKKTAFIACLLMLLTGTNAQAQVANYDVVPLPKSVNLLQVPGFVLNDDVRIVYATGNADMERNARFLSDYVKEMTGITLTSQPLVKKNDIRGNIMLALATTPKGKKKVTTEPNPEAYTINVTAKGVTITGQTPAAVFLGIQTLRKSLPIVKDNPQAVSLPAVVIQDEPRFAYRGMHLDCSRHFYPV